MNENASANSRSSAPFPAHLSQVASPAPRVPTRAEPSSVESIAPIDFGDDEDAMLEYALTLSRQLSQPDQSQPVTPPRNAPISQTTSTQDLSPSALRLIDLIEEALSIPLPSGGDSQNSSSSSSSSSSSDSRNHGYGSFGSHSSDEY